jgi:hypothetical protein
MFELLAVPQRGILYVQMGTEDLNLKICRITRFVHNIVAQTGYWVGPHPYTCGRRTVQFQQVYTVCLSWTTVVMLHKLFFIVGLNDGSVCACRNMLPLHALRKCRKVGEFCLFTFITQHS